MATKLRPRLPAPALAFLYPPRCLTALHRPFSTSFALSARQNDRPSTRSGKQDRRVQQQFSIEGMDTDSPKVMQKDLMKSDNMQGRDFGLLPDTFIMPVGRNKPSLTQWPRARMRLEWARVRRRVMDFFYVMAGKWAIIKPRPKLHTSRVPRIAQALQTRMYTAFAEGDTQTLYETCCDGLARTFTHRLSKRSERERWVWRLVRYRGRPRVVSHKIAAVPTGQKGQFIAIRQAVVRIRSEQALSKGTAEAEPRDLTEYLVLQQMSSPGDPLGNEWKVWGTLEEDKNMWKKYI